MKVAFEFSAGDLADVAGRTANRSRVVRRWRCQFRVMWAIAVGVIVYALTPGDPAPRAVFATLLAAILSGLMPLFGQRSTKDFRMLAYYREQLGGDGPFLCEVELQASGLVTRQMGMEIKHEWRQVDSIKEAPGGVEVIFRPTGTLLVRDSAFPIPAERQQFLTTARQYMESDTLD